MSSTNPWELEGVPWKNESQFMNFVRGVLRKGWSRHPVKLEFIKRNRIKVPNPNPNGRVDSIWGMECNMCHGLFPLNIDRATKKKIESLTKQEVVTIEINHKNEAGTLTCKEDIGRFAANLLFVGFDDLEALCKVCHGYVTYSQREGVSVQEAKLIKQAIKIEKSKEDRNILKAAGIKPDTNAKKRRLQLLELLRGGDYE